MASATPSLTLPNDPTPPQSFWARELGPIKQGIKTGIAGIICFSIYEYWHLPQGYWAVFAALVVTQANLGASWKAGLYRTIGSTCGAAAAALLIPLIGYEPVQVGIVLFLLASFFGYLTALHPSFAAAGFTAALVIIFSGEGEPWRFAWLRVLYTLLGAFVAFAVGSLIWPVHAREILRLKLATILHGAGELYGAVTAAALQGIENEQQVRHLDRKLHELRRGISQQMDEARSEIGFSRIHRGAYQEFIGVADQVRRRLTSMAEDRSLYVHAKLPPDLVPSLPALAERTARSFDALADAIRQKAAHLDPAEFDPAKLDAAIASLDFDLARLRTERTTSPFSLDRMLPFWALVFNLREVAQDLKQLQLTLPHLA